MSKVSDKLIEVSELLVQGLDVETVAKIAQVPVQWVIETELEMMGLHEHGYEGEYGEASFS